MYWRILLLFIFIQSLCLCGQIYSPQAIDTLTTAYTNGSPNDNIYVFCSPDINGNFSGGSLTAYSPSGTPNFNFEWRKYDNNVNSFVAYSTENNVASSTISGLTSGGYNVVVKDLANNPIGCYTAWLWVSDKDANIGPINPGCSPFNLSGTAGADDFVYYNPPAMPFLIDASTVITVCIDATHTYVSDLGFYLIGPASCGSPTITLAPNPGAINMMNMICNSGQNVNNLCFSTTATTLFDICAGAPFSPTGTFASYDPWSMIYGCDATSGGWSIQVYDCVSSDVGSLTNVTMTFTGNSSCGPSTVIYDSGPINSTIKDNSCTPGDASIYTVPMAEPDSFTLTNPFTYQWTSDMPGLVIPGATSSLNPLIDPSPTQDTWFYLSVTDSFNCTYTDSALFVYQSTTTPSISGGGMAYCNSDAPILFTGLPVGGLWSGNGIVNTGTGSFDPSLCSPGNNTIYYSLSGVCPATDSITIDIYAMPDIVDLVSNESCKNYCDGELNLSSNIGSGPFQYSIDGGATFSNMNIFPGLCPNTYYIEVLDANGCKAIDSTKINAAPSFSHQLSSFEDTCSLSKGQGVVDIIGGTGPYDYSWADVNGIISSTSSTSSLTDILGGLTGQTYYVTVTDSLGCTIIDSFTIQSTPSVVAIVPTQTGPSCYGYNDGSAMASSLGGQPPITFLWSNGNVGANISGLSGDTLYEVTVTDSFGCSAISSVLLTSPDTPMVASFIDDEKCSNSDGQIGVSTSGGVSPLSYSWGGGLGTSSFISNLSSGSYTITITDANNCETVKSYSIINIPAISGQMTLSDHCFGNSTDLDATLSNPAIQSWKWFTGDGSSVNGSLSNYTYKDTGAYNVNLITVDSNGCVDTIDGIINVYPNPEVYFWATDTQFCDSAFVQFVDSVISEPGANYIWNFGGLANTTQASPSWTFYNPGSYSVSLTVTSIHGCSTTITKGGYVNVTASPTAAFYMNPSVTTILEPNIYCQENGSGGNTFDWYVGSDTIGSGTNITHAFQDTGVFTITLAVTDSFGCTDTIYDDVYIAPDYNIFMPNVYTPNGDGMNDVFYPVGEFDGVKEFIMYIYNRWGEEIYISEDITKGWDGTYFGSSELVPDGAYVYFIQIRDFLEVKAEYKGIVFKLE